MTETNFAELYKERVDKSKEELEKQIYLITLENPKLRDDIRRGKEAKIKLEENEDKLLKLMQMHLDMKGELM